MTPVRCPRPGCQGTLTSTGFCDTCLRRPPEGSGAAATAPPPVPAPAPPTAPGAGIPGQRPGTDRAEDGPGGSSAPGNAGDSANSPDPDGDSRPSRSRRDGTRSRARGRDQRTVPRPAEPGTPHSTQDMQLPDLAPDPAAPNLGTLDSDGLVPLPDVPAPPLSSIARVPAPPPAGGRPCGVPQCPGTIGLSYGGGPPPDHGFCPECGTPFSFRPQLRVGDEIGEASTQTYRVLGYLSPGGTSWVYLAEDTELRDQRVVLKAQINNRDAIARLRAVEEMRSLASLHHRDVVSVISSRKHLAPGEDESTDYIVMEYIAGRPLNLLMREGAEELEELFGEPFALDHVVTYGCKILGALEYLHDQGLLYCDMKPANVIHYGRQIKLIDLGAVRRMDDRTTRLSYTRGFAPPASELSRRGFHVDSDLFTVGRTLSELYGKAVPAAGLAKRSFERLIARATHADPAARFTSAAQMSRQLWEVLREHRALSRQQRHPERSTRFEPTAVLFGAVLGEPPDTGYWTGRPEHTIGDAPQLGFEAPGPQEVARALPVPIPDPEDRAVVFLGRLGAAVPERVADRVRTDPPLRTVEVALWLCRGFLRRGDESAATQAAVWLAEAEQLMGRDVADYDWRLAWHRGLLKLMAGDVRSAQGYFEAVYDIVPGEWAPKLALGYCAEWLHDPEKDVRDYYQAVWERDRAQGSAAFGLVRGLLRDGHRTEAVRVLDQVPSTSRHYDTARTAAIRVLAGRLPGADPAAADLRDATVRVADRPPGGARDRLVAEIREHEYSRRRAAAPPSGAARAPGRARGPVTRLRNRLVELLRLGARRPVPRPHRAWLERPFPPLPPGELFDGASTGGRLAALLHESLHDLADQGQDTVERGDLLDRAYAIRPESSF
ncbi:serine/threonine protein kinase [Actinacidiphila yanglinensis]|uniref:non-specific serine/threonine protein kinase n=1 Tax=Actinacidiphila yanglinensis TaxID=310779 RepID=A0A1H5SB76_9ACTN|nr:serine/threonine-protein kinase [Actinacidiphila yanglinensis]SEF47913.1 serine/threonine protein kinase [Actinacidiphila yanglinensis]